MYNPWEAYIARGSRLKESLSIKRRICEKQYPYFSCTVLEQVQ